MIDPRELRSAFGTFMTGVTVITTCDADGAPRGFTANSFTSVSLDPPLLLVCIGKAAASCEAFQNAGGFAVNILAEDQKDVSTLFASKRTDKFTAARWHVSGQGFPLIEGAVAWFDCRRQQVVDAGDHIVLIGQVTSFAYNDANPLGYLRGGYVTLGLEQAAVNAVTGGGRTIVGAILECDGKLILMPDSATGGLTLPEVGRSGPSGSASLLRAQLRREGIEDNLGFLFAVFENAETHTQSIYYRGEALIRERGHIVPVSFDHIPWDRLPDEAVRAMLRRYSEERRQGRFRIYSGGHKDGAVPGLAQ